MNRNFFEVMKSKTEMPIATGARAVDVKRIARNADYAGLMINHDVTGKMYSALSSISNRPKQAIHTGSRAEWTKQVAQDTLVIESIAEDMRRKWDMELKKCKSKHALRRKSLPRRRSSPYTPF